MVTGGFEIYRCPRATFDAETDRLLEVHRDGLLRQMTAEQRMRAPARLISALEWCDEIVNDLLERAKDSAG